MEIEVLLELIELIMTQKDEVGDFVENIAKKKFVTDEGDLLVATKMRQIELVRYVLKSGVKPTLESFQYAAEHEFFELCRLFVEFGSREILSTPELEYQFRLANHGRLQEPIINLINQGVDPTAGDNFGIIWASGRGFAKTVRLLLEHGANPTVMNNLAIRKASEEGHLEVVRLLLKHRTYFRGLNNFAIKYTMGPDRLEIIKLLNECEANL
jgi:ankyrin repeat protein